MSIEGRVKKLEAASVLPTTRIVFWCANDPHNRGLPTDPPDAPGVLAVELFYDPDWREFQDASDEH